MKYHNSFTLSLLDILGLNHLWRTNLRYGRLAIIGLLAAFFILSAASEARAQAFTTNQRLLAGLPGSIPPLYDRGNSSGPMTLGQTAHIVYGIQVTSGNTSSSSFSLAVNLPTTAFTPTAITCLKFNGGIGAGIPLSGCTLGNLSALSIGALSNADDQVIAVVSGTFTLAGPYTATFTATRPNPSAASVTTSLNMVAQVTNSTVDISINKFVKPKNSGTFGLTASGAFGDTFTEKWVVKNQSIPNPNHLTDVYLGSLLHLQDILSTPGSNDVVLSISASATSFHCTPFLGADCPATPGSISTAMGNGQSQSLVQPNGFTYPTGSLGFLPAGGSFEITFDEVIGTNQLCSPGQNNKLVSTSFFTYSNGTNTVSDLNPANNTSAPTTVTLTGLPPTCIPPTVIPVTKVRVQPAVGHWGPSPFTYLITITNTSGTILTNLGMYDVIASSTGTPPFQATFNNASLACNPSCIGTLPVSSAPVINPQNSGVLFTAHFAPLPPNGVQTVQYNVQYDTPCEEATGNWSVTNIGELLGPATGYAAVATSMPALPHCQLAVTNIQTSGPTSFTSFPQNFGFHTEFKNQSGATIRVGSALYTAAVNSGIYGDVPISYSSNCTSTGVTNVAPLTQALTSAPSKYNNPVWAGIRLMDFSSPSGAVFGPSGKLSCDLLITVHQPPTNDSLCQGAGAPDLVTTALMDLSYPLDTNLPSLSYSQQATIPLPKCVSVVAGETAPANAFAGGRVTFTLTAYNAGSGSVPNLQLIDNVPPAFTNVTWTCVSGCATASGSGNSVAVSLLPLAGGATVTVQVAATAPNVLGSDCNTANVTFNPFPALTYFEGNQAALTTASACIQVTPAPVPILEKKIDPPVITSAQTVQVAFTLSNVAGAGPQFGLGFFDSLPTPPFGSGSVLSNSCGGTPIVSGNVVSLQNGSLPSGPSSCKVVFSMVIPAPAKCGIYLNLVSNLHGVRGLDASGMKASLKVECRHINTNHEETR